ncbi:oxygen-independent coproporphyrinogen III oxidase [Sneathiella aquimaris]|uniref:oxygen-independent coproporphyrinogen III oxidase n=1 Tax=Sneathiella aquimaris TaxID=2599305 RepID=UPI00146C7290|nr:oxygen-independent coproporphyrinogen III oxidase [Sneathiella aquimaris]
MTDNLARKYDAPVPRYTSYPTAPHFQPMEDGEEYGGWLQTLNRDTALSLYLHVPFCRQMCWYCGCNTKISQKDEPIAQYAAALRAELATVIKALPGRFKVSHVHWGGGTPSILAPDDFTSIMNMINTYFDYSENAERAIEIDPRTLDASVVEAMVAGGINRASLGVQDFNINVQRAINRVQSFETTKAAVDSLRVNGIERLNFDLMYGLPLQTVEDVRKTVALSHSLEPDRIALFGYAHVPWMKKHMRLINDADLPGTSERIAQAKAAADALLELGYVQIGLDHFARADDDMSLALKNGELQRNFQGYTTDSSDALIGIGASSIGKLPQGYVQNITSIPDYERRVLNNGFAISKGVAVSTDDKMRREIIERLMCDLAVDLAEVANRYNVTPEYLDDELLRLRSFEEDGLIDISGRKILVLEEGRYLVRTICAVFDTYLGNGPGKHSRAV